MEQLLQQMGATIVLQVAWKAAYSAQFGIP